MKSSKKSRMTPEQRDQFIRWIDSEMNRLHIKTDWALAKRGGFNSGSLTNVRKGREIGTDLAIGIAAGLEADPVFVLRMVGILSPDTTKNSVIRRVESLMSTWTAAEQSDWLRQTYDHSAALAQDRERLERPPKSGDHTSGVDKPSSPRMTGKAQQGALL